MGDTHDIAEGGQALLQSAADALFEQAAQALVVCDAAQRILYWNPAAATLYGYAAEDVQGRDYGSLIAPGEISEFNTAVAKIRRGRRVPARVLAHRRADGTLIEIDLTIYALPRAGALQGMLMHGSDAGPRREMERSLRQSAARVQAVVETVIDSIITINAEGIIDAVNPAAEELFGFRAHEMIGRNVSLLMPQPHRSQHDAYLRRYAETGEARVIGIGREVEAQRRDGTVFPVDLAVARMELGDGVGFVGVIRDISERKRAERQMQALNDRLEDKVAELAEALERLQRTQEQLVESEKLASLGSLVAGVSHEINTPIGVCLTSASFLAGELRSLHGKVQRGELRRSDMDTHIEKSGEATTILEKNLNRAAELVRSFKRVAVDRSGNFRREFELQGFIGELLSSLAYEIRNKPQEVVVDCEPDIVLDSYPGVLSQVLTNLLQNAHLHAYPDGAPGQIRIQARRQGASLQLVFSDDGIGIEAAALRKIFDPFYTTKRGLGGTGLGLSVSYNLVRQALGGTIEATSEPGAGTRFELTIPLVAAQEAPAGPGPDNRGEG